MSTVVFINNEILFLATVFLNFLSKFEIVALFRIPFVVVRM